MHFEQLSMLSAEATTRMRAKLKVKTQQGLLHVVKKVQSKQKHLSNIDLFFTIDIATIVTSIVRYFDSSIHCSS